MTVAFFTFVFNDSETVVKKQKNKDINTDYSFAYSTSAGYNPFESLASLAADDIESGDAGEGIVELHYVVKGRNGKPVTIVKNLPPAFNAEEIASELKKKLNTGGSVKDGEIILQGNCRKEIASWFASKKIKTKNVGG